MRSRLQVARCGCESRDVVAGRDMQVGSREMRLQVARCGCESRDAVAIAKCRGIGKSLAYANGVPVAYLWRTFVTPLS